MHCGWLQDSIWDLADSQWRFLQELPYALVTCIDSIEDLTITTTARKIVEAEGDCRFLGVSLLVGNARIVDVAKRHKLFSHFDEVWLCRNPPADGKPAGTSIVSPTDLSFETPPRELLEWFSASDCVLGLGDGIGMNYVTTSEEIVLSLENRQREFME